ncbi:helix-turn-helix domain-containing protein [Tabrizicola sp.]|uniref:TetR/AcrR family transcriptional regulator n=1 Tax=Tabrizicola sp. TaxID=2005166 RepID=UPI00286A6E34|nr:helix-turn-helix domain-containing protein [Tabrizicola sp.]
MTQTDAFADKQEMILNAAFHAFAAYGFRRTTMDDIARGAGMSRSALYLHFSNKEDIFRSLTERHFNNTIRDMERALNMPGRSPAEALHAAFVAKDGKFMDVVLGTPHGRELLDAGFSLAADIAEAGEVRMTEVLAAFLKRHRLAPGVGTADEMSETLNAALKGLKFAATSLDAYRAGQARLAALFAMALSSPD